MSIYTVFDVETTGLSIHSDIPLCFSYVSFKTGLNDITHAGTLLFYKSGQKHGAENIHGLSVDFLKEFETSYSTNIKTMYKVLCRGNLIGHNIESYDLPLIVNFYAERGYYDLTPQSIYDTVYFSGSKKIKLSKLVESLNIDKDFAQYFSKKIFKDSPLRGTTEYHSSEYDTIVTLMSYLSLKSGNEVNL